MRRWCVAISIFCVCLSMGCDTYEQPVPRRDRLNFPIGLALHPSNNYLYVVNSNFDSRYSPERGGTVSVVDTNTNTILAQSSPSIPSFGGHIALNDDATKAYVAARTGDNLVVLDIEDRAGLGPGSSLSCGGSDDGTECALHRIPDIKDAPELASDPFGVEVVTVMRDEVPVDVVAMSYLTGNLVSAVSLPRGDRASATMVSAPLLSGGNQIARRPGTLEMYVSGRSTNQVAVFLPYINNNGDAEAIFARRTLTLNTLSTNVDARGIAFSTNGDRLYVSTRRPDALHIFKVLPASAEDGSGIIHQLEHMIPLGDSPAEVYLHQVPGGGELVFVPCYDEKNIHVIDPALGVVKSIIELDETPYEFVAETAPSRCGAPGERCLGYVSLFTDSPELSTSCDDSGEGCGSVGVIDLDPASSRYLQLISKIR